MFGIREKVCFLLALCLIEPPAIHRTRRQDEVEKNWGAFASEDLRERTILDFGSGAGELSYILASKGAKRVVGVEIEPSLIAKAESARCEQPKAVAERVEFIRGEVTTIPIPDQSVDVIAAMDVMEHVMRPPAIMREWKRVLRPGGRVLISWCPFLGPYGAHMESLVPIPWAHALFGEQALFRTAAKIYDHHKFVPRPWGLDEAGNRRPNKWKQWSTFREQGFLNQISVTEFRTLAERVGFQIERFETRTFQGSPVRRILGGTLLKVPVLHEFGISSVVATLIAPVS